jgi:hypothetical protein
MLEGAGLIGRGIGGGRGCGLGGTQTQCQSPGNVQINDAPPQVNYFPLGDD